jgi:hypothetical protein
VLRAPAKPGIAIAAASALLHRWSHRQGCSIGARAGGSPAVTTTARSANHGP